MAGIHARVRYFLDQIHGSYWFIPTVMALAAVGLAVGMREVDRRLTLEMIREAGWLVYIGGPEGARAVLSTIAGSMITVAGVVFSITIVALTLASSQFGPRVLSSFMRDRGNQTVLGTFLATFLYCLLVLRTIRSGDFNDTLDAVVPHVSVTIAVLLAVLSLGVLIYFIHHVSISIQAPNLIAQIARDLHRDIDSLFPETVGDPTSEVPDSLAVDPGERFQREASRVEAEENGYVEGIDMQGLMELATEHQLVLRLEYRPGHFVMRGSTLARAWPGERVDEPVLRRIRGHFVLGTHRTSLQDVEYPVNQLVEVAVRALSPGINDPFTALTCIDQIGAALCHLCQRHLPSRYRLDGDRELRLVIVHAVTFTGVVDAALHQVRQNASYHAAVYARLLEMLARVTGCARTEEQLDPLLHHGRLILEAARRQVEAEEDRDAVEARHRKMLHAMERKREDLRG